MTVLNCFTVIGHCRDMITSIFCQRALIPSREIVQKVLYHIHAVCKIATTYASLMGLPKDWINIYGHCKGKQHQVGTCIIENLACPDACIATTLMGS